MREKLTKEKIENAAGFEALAILCQDFSEHYGIQLTGTYSQMAEREPRHAAAFRAFAVRAKNLSAR